MIEPTPFTDNTIPPRRRRAALLPGVALCLWAGLAAAQRDPDSPANMAPLAASAAASAALAAFGMPPRRATPGASLTEAPTPLPASAASLPATVVPVPPLVPPRAGAPSVIDERWRESLDAFAATDRLHAPVPGGVLFVGSSSIRMWNDLETQFQTAAVIKRGFGGSRMSDCALYVANLVLPYRPRLVVVYAGDNDLAEGRTPAEVLASFRSFVEQVRAELPRTRIAYLSIKPSPLRASLMPAIVETNALIERYVASVPNLDFIDIYARMLDDEGKPRTDIFMADGLHMNPQGYAIWKTVISSHLAAPAPPAGVSPPLLSK